MAEEIKVQGAEASTAEKPASRPVRSKKKKVIRHVSTGRAYVQATYNNTIVTLTDANGNVLSWSSAGVVGFTDLMGAVAFERDGHDLDARGLYLDMPPWGYHVFEMSTVRPGEEN